MINLDIVRSFVKRQRNIIHADHGVVANLHVRFGEVYTGCGWSRYTWNASGQAESDVLSHISR